ncbi:hypothetical protein PSACC_03550 [Paramicrosporidium saccamoebae]|uniref:WAC domain-containing protein n=1 Tax=Paramicrosporidium saccamoebae TaxID=1246581 RepID=A0A2H9TFU3_9FUNG|nr:hypothetical protein PSACC_03550 [Paramicrosporidium saccamoebae]
MPILRRSVALSLAALTHKNPANPSTEGDEVYLVSTTGEYFYSYDQPVWTCRLTGHTGLTYGEAGESEIAAQKSLELFPEWWKLYTLTAIHCSTEPIEALTTRIGNYYRDHLALNEPVRLPFDEVLYEGVVSVAPKFEEEDTSPAPYRISINQGEMIITGACKGPEDVQYDPP